MSERDKQGPSHIVYNVRESKHKDESYWDRCGVAFEHGDKEGFNVELSAIPVNGRLTLRMPREREERDDSPRETRRESRKASRERER